MLHNRFYDIARTDLDAANILAKNNLYPQAIYFYEQAYEKASKSVIAFFYISYKKEPEKEVLNIVERHSHNLMKLGFTTTKLFIDYVKELHVKRGGGKEIDEFIESFFDSLRRIYGHKPEMVALIAFYPGTVKALYKIYARVGENSLPIEGEDPKWGVIRELYKRPDSKYRKFNLVSRLLFILLDKMDIYARYPMIESDYANIGFLKEPEMREACSLLGEMVGDLVSLVPLVWKKIESLKT